MSISDKLNELFELTEIKFSTTVVDYKNEAFLLKPFNNEIDKCKDPKTLVVRVAMPMREALLALENPIEIISKYKTACNLILDLLLKKNGLTRKALSSPNFNLFGVDGEYFRMLEDINAYELSLYAEVNDGQ